MGFIDLEKTYDRVNKEALRQVLRMYDVGGKDNLRGLLGIRRMDRFPNSWIRGLCGVRKSLDERIDEGVLRWFVHVKRIERDKIAKRVYVEECAGSRSVGRPRKRWTDTVKEMLQENRFRCQASKENGPG